MVPLPFSAIYHQMSSVVAVVTILIIKCTKELRKRVLDQSTYSADIPEIIDIDKKVKMALALGTVGLINTNMG